MADTADAASLREDKEEEEGREWGEVPLTGNELEDEAAHDRMVELQEKYGSR